MTEQKERPVVERIQSFYEAFATKGIEGAAELLNEDEFSWHVPGENPLSGVYHGVAGYKELGGRCPTRTNGASKSATSSPTTT